MIYCAEKYSTTNNNFHFKVKNINDTSTMYIYYYLYQNLYILENGFTGVNQKKISKDYISKIKIPLPSLEVQEQCITLFEQKEAYIESIDKKIAEHKNYLEELKALAKDVITSFC